MTDPTKYPEVGFLAKYLDEYDYSYAQADGTWVGHWFTRYERGVIIGQLIQQEYDWHEVLEKRKITIATLKRIQQKDRVRSRDVIISFKTKKGRTVKFPAIKTEVVQ